ncbi:MAG: ATP-binding cassette domain-containing protein, partial [Akkermansia muciniphila]
ESVCFSYSGKQWIFEDYNRVFTSGITILKGYSGCGKTTLLKILAGYLKPQSGRVVTPRRKVPADSLYRRKEVSYMFQGLNLLPLATVERNLQLCAEMAMLPKKQWTRRADDLITRLGLESLRHKKAGSLSGGQAQRAALARTMMKDSDVLLLDEPTSGLDDGNTEIIKNLIREYPADKICILSTHDSRLFDLTHEIMDFNLSVSL